MAFMLKLRWDIKSGQEETYRQNQKALCQVIKEDHPGVICYHADYPSPNVCEWVEIYANDDAFRAHLGNPKGGAPLGALIEASDAISCKCWGDPDEANREILAGFGAVYQTSADSSYCLHPAADRNSKV